MSNRVLFGVGKQMLPVPAFVWQRMMKAGARKTAARLGFMSQDHHRVRDFVVLELPRSGVPLSLGMIAEALDLSLPRISTIVEELERNLTFLCRNEEGKIAWAYPVTVDETPHRARFAGGEEAYSP
jgi:hypothetical protein